MKWSLIVLSWIKFLDIYNMEETKKLQEIIPNNIVLKFTYELKVNNKIPFLDVLIDPKNDSFNTSI